MVYPSFTNIILIPSLPQTLGSAARAGQLHWGGAPAMPATNLAIFSFATRPSCYLLSWLVVWVTIGIGLSNNRLVNFRKTHQAHPNNTWKRIWPPANIKHHLKDHGVALDLFILGTIWGVFNIGEMGLLKLVNLLPSKIGTTKWGQLTKVKQDACFSH